MITRLIKFFLLQFMNIADGDLSAKFSGAFKISLAVTPILFVWDKIAKWGISNQDYILIVLMAILLDWFFGIIKHLQKRSLRERKLFLLCKCLLNIVSLSVAFR